MKVKEVIKALQKVNEDMEFKVIDTNAELDIDIVSIDHDEDNVYVVID